MNARFLFIAAVVGLNSTASVAQVQQPPTTPPKKESYYSTLTGASRALIARRAKFFYRMPDGTYWDSWNYVQCRRVLDQSLTSEKIIEKGTPSGGPGVSFREDKEVGIRWIIRKTPDAMAWGFDRDEKGELPTIRRIDGRRLEEDDDQEEVMAILPKGYSGDIRLWSSVERGDPPFIYIDETNPDAVTRRQKRGYLEVKAVLGEGVYRVEGYSLEEDGIEGTVVVKEPRRFVHKQWFKGEFFLWKDGAEDWRLIPADELRVTPEQLAEAILNGDAELEEWKWERTDKDTFLWTRTVREIRERPEAPIPNVSPGEKKPQPPRIGRDVLILTTGEYYEGRLISQDDKEVVFLTIVGNIKTELRVERHRVSTVNDWPDDEK